MIEFDPVLVHEWLVRAAERYPEKEALIAGARRWTYRQLDQASDKLAFSLTQIGIKRGDRVIVFMDNSPETVISLYAILKAGGVFVVLNGSLKAGKLNYILNNSGASAIIFDSGKHVEVAGALENLENEICCIVSGSREAIKLQQKQKVCWWSEMVAEDKEFARKVQKQALSCGVQRCIDIDLACLIYTSGSTGEPKGVMSTHHNMISAARSIIQYIGNEVDDIILCVLPLSFDYGLYQVIMAVMFGGTVVLEKSFMYLHPVLKKLGDEKVTAFPVVPTVMSMLLGLDDISAYNFSRLRYITNTGAALPEAHIRKFRELFPGVKIFSMYGLTECKRVSYLPPADIDRKALSVGKAIPNCEVKIVDKEGREVPPGEVGELIVRGSNVMQGYWNDQVLTQKAYRAGRYPAERSLYSGDSFRYDDNKYLYFVGREGDMIKSRGERLSAKEIENTITSMEGVSEVAVIGVPDEVIGQAVKAFVVNSPGYDLTENDLKKYCAANMEPYAMPKYFVFLKDMPKSPNGKIDKKALG